MFQTQALPFPNEEETDLFIALYRERFGEEISKEEGFRLALAVVRLVYPLDHPDVFAGKADAVTGAAVPTAAHKRRKRVRTKLQPD